jgi:hypothetical protein
MSKEGYKRDYTRITAEAEILDTWSGGNPRSPMLPPSQNDGSTEP